MTSRKILIMGLPGAGKTTLATLLAKRLNAVHFNADAVRENINRDLGFSPADRIEQARRMGWLCDRVTATGNIAIADFVCPTEETRSAFAAGGDALVVWVDRIAQSRYPDTDQLFVPPRQWDVRVAPVGNPEFWTEQVAARMRPVFDARQPTALFIGHYQPFLEEHRAQMEEAIRRVGQACVAVRGTGGADPNSASDFEHVRSRIEHGLRTHKGRFIVVSLPNITNIFYGRDVNDVVQRLDLDRETEGIPGTRTRAGMVG